MTQKLPIARSSFVRRLGFLSVPVIGLLICYLLLGLSASSRKSITSDEGSHFLGGYSYWVTNDYRFNSESGNWVQRWAALPIWLFQSTFPLFDGIQWQHISRFNGANQFVYDSGQPERILLLGRLMIGLLGVALALLIYLWSQRLYGPLGGLISLTLYAFCPVMLAHGFLITADLSLTLFLLASVGSLWALMHRISLGTLALSCFTVTGLFMSKYSSVAVAPMALLLLIIRLFNPAPLVVALPRPQEIRGLLRKFLALMVAMLLVTLGVWTLIWASYGFRYSMYNPAYDQSDPPPRLYPNLGFIGDVLQFADENHLLPQAYLQGYSYTVHSAGYRSAFLNGEFRARGWLEFFPYAVAVKTPLELFLILALAACCFYRPIALPGSLSPTPPFVKSWLTGLYRIAPLLVLFAVYWIFALVSHLNIGLRHVLPTYPPMFILAGAAAGWFRPSTGAPRTATNRPSASNAPIASQASPRWKVAVRGVIGLALVLSALEAIWFWPDYLAYFNLLAGGPSDGYKHLVDSSLDWGQDVKELKRWFQAHPADVDPPQRVYLSLFNDTAQEYYGIRGIALPTFMYPHQPFPPEPLRAGTYCISATEVQNVLLFQYRGRWNKRYEESYQNFGRRTEMYRKAIFEPSYLGWIELFSTKQQWYSLFDHFARLRFARLCSYLRHRKPDDEVGHSILIYRLTDDDLANALDGPPVELLDKPEAAMESPP